MSEKSLHSICRWTFNPGKGGFVPANMRPEFGGGFSTVDMIRVVKDRIAPRLPENIQLGLEVHYNNEVDKNNAPDVADALVGAKMYLAMGTPGAHIHWGFGGIASLDPGERRAANEFGQKTVDLMYGPLRKAWHPDADKAPSLVLWNGSWANDLMTPATKTMVENLDEGVAGLVKYENSKGGLLYKEIEPKGNEGHASMLIPTVEGAIAMWSRIAEKYKIPLDKCGVNKEFGHSQMIGLDPVYETVVEILHNQLYHMHLNSQGYEDGIHLGGPGKFDIDLGVAWSGGTISIARLIQDSGYSRWKGHDMQPRAHDNEAQAVDRVVRSVLMWEACAKAGAELDMKEMINLYAKRETAKVADMMRHAMVSASNYFDQMYKG